MAMNEQRIRVEWCVAKMAYLRTEYHRLHQESDRALVSLIALESGFAVGDKDGVMNRLLRNYDLMDDLLSKMIATEGYLAGLAPVRNDENGEI